jgi:hypothetical protein
VSNIILKQLVQRRCKLLIPQDRLCQTLLFVHTGGVISALVSGIFYWLGGRGLAKEAKRLHDLNVLLLRAFEEAGLARLNRDASGQPIGLVLERAAVLESASASDSCDAEIIRAPSDTLPN